METNDSNAYRLAQTALADLKTAVRMILGQAASGMSNAEIGRALGIYGGHIGHEGHISRTLLAMLEAEGVAVQDSTTKRWRIRGNTMIDQDSVS